MSMIRPVLTDFSAGELSPRLAGRVDLPIYYRGAQELTNFQVRSMGGVSKRPGTKYITGTLGNAKARLIPMVIDAATGTSTVSVVLELTAGKIRAIDHATGGIILVGGVAVELATSYTVDELFEVQYVQTRNEIFMVHPSHPPVWIRFTYSSEVYTIEFSASKQNYAGNLLVFEHTNLLEDAEGYDLWEKLAQWLIPNKEYVATGKYGISQRTITKVVRNDLSLTLYYGSNESTTINRSDAITYYLILSVDLRPFYGTGNYPGSVAYFAGRLWLGGSINDPAVLWGSRPNDPFNFTLCDEVEYETSEVTLSNRTNHTGTTASGSRTIAVTSTPGIPVEYTGKRYATGINIPYGAKVAAISPDGLTVTLDMECIATGACAFSLSSWVDADVPEYADTTSTTQQIGAGAAVRLILATEENERIRWIAGHGDLYVGTNSSEWIIPGTSNAIQARAILVSRYGSAAMQARFIGTSIVYVSSSSRHLRQITTDGLAPPVTMQAEHIPRHGITQIDFSQAPDVCLWAVLGNGELARCLFDIGAGGTAWDRIKLSTTGGYQDAVESVAVVSGADRDCVYIVAKRRINGAWVRWIEQFQETDDLSQMDYYLDAASELEDVIPFSFVGVSRFAGSNVSLLLRLANGTISARTAIVASDGAIAIPESTRVIVGLPYTARLKTHRLESPETDGLMKGVGRIFFRLFRSWGFVIRHSENGEPIPLTVETMTTGPVHVTTDIPMTVDAELIVESLEPFPVGIQTIIPDTTIGA